MAYGRFQGRSRNHSPLDFSTRPILDCLPNLTPVVYVSTVTHSDLAANTRLPRLLFVFDCPDDCPGAGEPGKAAAAEGRAVAERSACPTGFTAARALKKGSLGPGRGPWFSAVLLFSSGFRFSRVPYCWSVSAEHPGRRPQLTARCPGSLPRAPAQLPPSSRRPLPWILVLRAIPVCLGP